MKKTILLSALFTVAAVSIFGTANAQKGFYLTAQGAPQMTVMVNSDDIDDDNMDIKAKLGVTFGVGGGYNFNKHMGVGTEVMYSMERQRYENHGIGYTQRLDYLKIPVLFNYNTNPAKKFVFTAKAGPQIGLLIDDKITDADKAEFEIKKDDKYEDVTFGAMAGAGVRMNMTNNLSLNAGLRFDGTFTNSENEDAKGYSSDRAKTYNFNAGLEVGVRYSFN